MSAHSALVVIFALLLIGSASTGCASTKPYIGVALSEDAFVIEGVPAIKQSSGLSCGPACVASVGLYWTRGTIERDWRSEPTFRKSGTSGVDLCAAANAIGLDAFAFAGGLEDLETNVKKGRPVIIMAYCGFMGETVIRVPYYRMIKGFLYEIFPPKHWVVVIGTIQDEWFLVQDPEAGRYQVKKNRLLKGWRKNKFMSVLLAPRSQRLPEESAVSVP